MPALIDRPALTALVRHAVAEHRITFLSAPLGAGKTATLALAFGVRHGLARVDAESWQRGASVATLVDVVRRHRPDFGRRTLGALANGATAERLGRIFAGDLAHVDAPLSIVIDNAHVFYDEPDFATFLQSVVSANASDVRFVLACRWLPDDDFVGAFARRDATLVHAGVFRFDRAEIAAYARAIGRELDEREVVAIEAATDGWAAAIVLAAFERSAATPALRSVEAAATYLETTLLPSLDARVVAFLEETAIFATLDLALLDRSPAFAGATAMIAHLRRGGALVADTDVARVYRVHPILRRLARDRLARRGGVARAHAAAVDAYVSAGRIAGALHHAVASDDPRVAADFLRAHAREAIATGDRVRVREALERLDPSGPDADVAAFVRGLDEKASGSPALRASFARAAEATTRTGDVAIDFFARAQIVEYDLGRLGRVDASDLTALDAGARTIGPRAMATAGTLAGWAHAIGFDFERARARVAPFANAGDAGARFDTGILLAYAQTALGDAAGARATLDAIVRALENDDRIVLQTLALVWYGRLALAWGATRAAADAATQAERLANDVGFAAEEAALYALATELATHRGDLVASVAYAERARAAAPHAWYVADVARTRAFAEVALARAAFLNHDNDLARDLARRVALAADTPVSIRALALAEAAVYGLLCNAPDAATQIDEARDATRAARPLDVGDAVALATAGDVLAFLDAANGAPAPERLPVAGPFDALIVRRRGLLTLELAGVAVANARAGRASNEAVSIAFERVSKDGPRFEVRLARAYASRYVRNVPARPAAPPATFDLTAREREILALLVDGLTNKEIAQRLVLGTRTVETHVERVLGKLNVGTRSRAIAKALRVGLVTLARLGDP